MDVSDDNEDDMQVNRGARNLLCRRVKIGQSQKKLPD